MRAQVQDDDSGQDQEPRVVDYEEQVLFPRFRRLSYEAVAADDLHLYGAGFTSESAALIERAFRDVHLLAYVKQVELAGSDRRHSSTRLPKTPVPLRSRHSALMFD
ncbi:MAG: hypothetical protein OXF33_03125 [Rhodospirillales bacterium]|nr:hypothetical protein [Rhodospirillales bacterium]